MNALELKGLEKRYSDFCLGPLDLTLPGGTICGLIGENGAGKSTTIRLILDILQRDGGSIRVLGQENSAAPQRLKTEVGVVLEGGGLPGTMNPVQIGRMMADIYPNWDAAAYKDYCQRFGLPEKKAFGAFSKGMRMKQCIAVALSHHPKLLLLDEATSGLDPVARDELLDILLDFARDEDHSILISSHIVSDLEKLCDTIAFLHKGRLMLCEDKDTLILLDFARDEDHSILISSHIVSDLEKLCDTIAFLHKGRLMLCEDKDTLRDEYALWHGSAAEFAALDPAAVRGKRVTPYGAEALVRREDVPQGSSLTPVSIEELFVMMVKGEDLR